VHADRRELLDWIASARTRPQAAYLVHGEPEPAAELARDLRTELAIPAIVAENGLRIQVHPGDSVA